MNFSATACVRFGWETFKKRPWFFVGLALIMVVISWIIGAIAGVFGSEGEGSFLGSLVNLALSALLSMGFTATMLKAHDAVETAQFGDLWHPSPYWKFLGAQVLTLIIVTVGFVLLIIPGLFAAMVLLFVPYLVIEKKLNPFEAIRESFKMTEGNRWQLALLFLLVVVLNIVGMLAVLVGLLVSIPVTVLALVHAYRALQRTSIAA